MNIIVNRLVSPFAIKIGPVSVIYMIISWKEINVNLEQPHLEVKKSLLDKCESRNLALSFHVRQQKGEAWAAIKWRSEVKLLSRVRLLETPWTLPGSSVRGIFQARVLEEMVNLIFFLSIFMTALESQSWFSHSLCIVIKGRKWVWAAFTLKLCAFQRSINQRIQAFFIP